VYALQGAELTGPNRPCGLTTDGFMDGREGDSRISDAEIRGFPAARPEGPHPFPSRTRSLSPPGPMVLHW
jgi:hypothetical protein